MAIASYCTPSRPERPVPGECLVPAASIIIPTLNESRNITPLLEQLLATVPASVLEIMVADGGSVDATRDIVLEFAARDPRVKLIPNPGRIQAVGVNTAARVADPRSNVLIRMDAHATYGLDFIETLLTEMKRPDVDSVVVRMTTVGTGCFQSAVAMVSNTGVGTGGAAHRVGTASGFVDHGHHAAFRRQSFDDLGGYDEEFATNEDAEFDHRLTAMGGRIWLSGEAEVRYIPRSTPTGLARQYARYGAGRLRNLWKHRAAPKLRQMVPVVLTIYVFGCLPTALLLSPVVLLPLVAYGALLAGATTSALARNRTACALYVPLALVIMHIAWGLGFLGAMARAAPGAIGKWSGRRKTELREAPLPEPQKDRGSPVNAAITAGRRLPKRAR